MLLVEGTKLQLAHQLGPSVLSVGERLAGLLEVRIRLAQQQAAVVVVLEVGRIDTS
jgi:hypothetical protein